MVCGLLMLLRGRGALGIVRLWRRDAVLGCGSVREEPIGRRPQIHRPSLRSHTLRATRKNLDQIHPSLGSLVQALLWQTQKLILHLFRVYTRILREKSPCKQQLGKPRHIPSLDLRETVLVALPGRLVSNSPIGVGCLCYALHALEDVVLADEEAMERKRTLVEIKPETTLTTSQAIIVPKATADSDPLHSKTLNLISLRFRNRAKENILAKLDIVDVTCEAIGHDVRYTCFRSSPYKLTVGVLGRRWSQGDDEELLVLQSGYETGLVVIVDLSWGDTLWDVIGAGIAKA
ncbi:hypothetical protein HG530_001639 [Fusarium avenaceum]|nr:hypothetical protein HG530_001639 [Fusarium avenaceum]